MSTVVCDWAGCTLASARKCDEDHRAIPELPVVIKTGPELEKESGFGETAESIAGLTI